MSRPTMTDDQRVMAVALLANAIRKRDSLQARAEANRGATPLGLDSGLRRSAEAAGHYVQGMRDLLAVLFEGGGATADACYAQATAQARGEEATGHS